MSIKDVLMNRGIAEHEAESIIDDAREEFESLIAEGDLESAYEICGDYFGLEPDYLDELI